MTSDLLLKKNIIYKSMSHISYVNGCGYTRKEAKCFPHLQADPTINLDTSFSLFVAPLLHQGSKCKSEDQKEGNRKLPLHAECWCCSCYCCVGALFDSSTGSRSHQLWSLTSFKYLGKDSLHFSVKLIHLYLILPNNTCNTKKKHFYNEKAWHQ